MSENPDFYDFCGVRLFLIDTHIEVIAEGKRFTPSKNHRAFLLALARNAPEMATYRHLWKEIWHLDEPSDTDLRNIQTTKGNLVGWLKSIGIKKPPIESVPGQGYRLNCQVLPGRFEPKESDLFKEKTSRFERREKTASEALNYDIPLRDADSSPGENDLKNPQLYSKADLSDKFLKDGLKRSSLIFGLFSNKDLIFGVAIALIITISLIYRQYDDAGQAIFLHRAEFVSEPIPNNQFFVRLIGKNIPPETVRLRVVGPGCGGDAPCTVSNGALRLFGRITESSVEKAPLTLASGEFQIWLENEANGNSNKLIISVPGAGV